MTFAEFLIVTLICAVLLYLAIKQKIYIGVGILILAYIFYIGDAIIDSFKSIDDDITVPEYIIEADTVEKEIKELESVVPVPDTVESKMEPEVADEIQSTVSLERLLICKGVTNERVPVEPGIEFYNDVGSLTCWTAFSNPFDSVSVRHDWYYNDRLFSQVNMTIGRSLFWRVWSNKRIIPNLIGKWTVSVLNSDGVELGSIDFNIIEKAVENYDSIN